MSKLLADRGQHSHAVSACRFRLEDAIRAIGPVDSYLRALVRGYAPPNPLNAIPHETG